MSNIVINGKIVEDPIDFKKTSDDLHKMALSKSREAFRQQQEETYKNQHTPMRITNRKIGRNDPCPCGSNKKFKKCCIAK